MSIFSATGHPSSETAPAPPPPQVAPKPRRLWLIVAVAVIVIVVIAGVFAYWWLSRPAPASQAAWVFDGAYATYSGQTTVSFVTVNMTMRLEVVEFNNTHAKLLTYMKMESNLIAPIETQNTTWTDLRTASYEVEGYDLTQTREDDVYIEGFGTKHCIIYDYSGTGMTMTYYVDKEIGWPLKMAFSVSQGTMDMDFNLTLTETNIPEL